MILIKQKDNTYIKLNVASYINEKEYVSNKQNNAFYCEEIDGNTFILKDDKFVKIEHIETKLANLKQDNIKLKSDLRIIYKKHEYYADLESFRRLKDKIDIAKLNDKKTITFYSTNDTKVTLKIEKAISLATKILNNYEKIFNKYKKDKEEIKNNY